MYNPENVSRVVFSVYHTEIPHSAVGGCQWLEVTRALLGYLAERTPLWGGGQILSLPPPPDSRTGSRSETGEARIESS